jgi:transketolase
MDSYGASAPAPELFDKYGFTIARVTATVKELLAAG